MQSVKKKNNYKLIGIRPGEKLHEEMISIEDSFFTYEFKKFYKILPSILSKKKLSMMSKNGKRVKNNFSYKSNVNNNWISSMQLKKWLRKNPNFF